MAFSYSQTLQFPSDLSSNSSSPIMNLSILEYSKENLIKTGVTNRLSTISLPMPIGFEANYAAGWSTQSLGAIGNEAVKYVNDFKTNLEKQGKNGSIADAMRATFNINDATNSLKKVGQSFALDAVEFVSPGATNAIMRGLGVTRNPFNAVLYEGPDFRRFNFTWRLHPRNAQESEAILNIYKSFKVAQATSVNQYSNMLLDYPKILDISTSVEDKTFKIAPCAILNVGYNPMAQGAALFHKDNAPVAVDLSLSLVELTIITSDMASEY